jgi:hypothetical protein
MKMLLTLLTVLALSVVCAISTGPAQAKPGGVMTCVSPAIYLHCNPFGNCYCSLYP